jgi:hypothetical protein
MEEREARELLANPGVCARYRVDPTGNVVFRDSPSRLGALVVAAVFAASPAFAGGRAAETPDAPSWGDWLVELVAGSVFVQGAPLPDPMEQPEQFLMGDVAEIIEPAERTLVNNTSEVLRVTCPDSDARLRVLPGEEGVMTAEAGSECVIREGAGKVLWTGGEVRCTKTAEGMLRCE